MCKRITIWVYKITITSRLTPYYYLKSFPRNFLMVFAFAGDSAITKFFAIYLSFDAKRFKNPLF